MRKIGEKCNDVQSHKCAEFKTCIFYSLRMALNFPEMTLLYNLESMLEYGQITAHEHNKSKQT